MISRKRHDELIRHADTLAGRWLDADCDAAEDWGVTDPAEEDVVRARVRHVARTLINGGHVNARSS